MAKQLSYNEALTRAASICSISEKCKSDIIKKLNDWKIEFNDINKIIEYLEKEKYIDEKRYAEFFVRDKFRFNKWGKIKISAELQKKQIPENYIYEALNQISTKDYLQTAKELLAKKEKSLKETDAYKRKTKLMRFLASRGFEQEIIYEITN